MYILIEEKEDFTSGDVYYKHENKVCSNSLDEIYEYCKKTYTMSENEMSELMKYKSVDDIYNQYRLPRNLIIKDEDVKDVKESK